MLQTNQVEELIALAASLDRDALIAQFTAYRASFPVDFTRKFLNDMPVDKLRHIFVALCLQQQRMPNNTTPAAA